jgi:hypothetical protein
MQMSEPTDRTLAAPTDWRPLYRIAFAAIVIMIVLIPIQIALYFLVPPPTTAEGFLTLFGQDPWLGLLSLDLLYIVNSVLMIPLYLALFVALQGRGSAWPALAVTSGFVGLAAYFPSNPAFEMLRLSQRLPEAVTEAQRQALLASAETLLAIYVGTAFNVYYVLNAAALILLACSMIRSTVFSRATGWIGLVSGLLMVIPSTAGTLGLVFSLLSLIPWILFAILVGVRFYRLGKSASL